MSSKFEVVREIKRSGVIPVIPADSTDEAKPLPPFKLIPTGGVSLKNAAGFFTPERKPSESAQI